MIRVRTILATAAPAALLVALAARALPAQDVAKTNPNSIG